MGSVLATHWLVISCLGASQHSWRAKKRLEFWGGLYVMWNSHAHGEGGKISSGVGFVILGELGEV